MWEAQVGGGEGGVSHVHPEPVTGMTPSTSYVSDIRQCSMHMERDGYSHGGSAEKSMAYSTWLLKVEMDLGNSF